MMSHSPLLIVGAGRSGTNALRDALAQMQDFHTWPCDEINYIWRHGNRDFPTDELLPEHATPDVRQFIGRAFEKRQAKDKSATVVEKTCANSLRIGFVQRVLPTAKFVIIERDALDVVSSAIPRWSAPLDVRYLARKARWVPPDDLVHYALRYFRSRLGRSEEGRLSTWGPRFDGLDELVNQGTALHEICAHQWVACMDSIEAQSDLVPATQLHRIRYEELVTDPTTTLSDLVRFAGRVPNTGDIKTAAAGLRSTSIGAWRDRLTSEQVQDVRRICESRD